MSVAKFTALNQLTVGFALAALLLTPACGQSSTNSSSAPTLAAYFSDTSTFYVEHRVDADFLADLTEVYTPLRTELIAAGVISEYDLPHNPLGSFDWWGMLLMLTYDCSTLSTFTIPFPDDYPNPLPSWMRSRIAVAGHSDPASDAFFPPTLFVFETSDRTQAAVFLDNDCIMIQDATKEETANYTLYTGGYNVAALRDDVMFFSGDLADIPLEGVRAANLAQDSIFQTALQNLPEDSYDALFYLNGDDQDLLDDVFSGTAFEDVENAIRVIVLAGKIQADGALIFDVLMETEPNRIEERSAPRDQYIAELVASLNGATTVTISVNEMETGARGLILRRITLSASE